MHSLDDNNKQGMDFLRKHWYDLGGFLSILVFIYVFVQHNILTHYQLLLWLSLITLFLHQLEEYRIVGTFPGMMNSVMYGSKKPDRYPLNTNTAFFINVGIGWTCYFLAAAFAEKTIWLGMATILVSIGNIIAHTVVFNIKGRSLYNAGMLTSCLLFSPCIYFYFFIIHTEHLATTMDYIIGIPLGIIINVVGVLKVIEWMADENTAHTFDERNLLAKDRMNFSKLTQQH
jgi:hypothetical protein